MSVLVFWCPILALHVFTFSILDVLISILGVKFGHTGLKLDTAKVTGRSIILSLVLSMCVLENYARNCGEMMILVLLLLMVEP